MQENGQSQANAPVYQQNGKSVSYSSTWQSSQPQERTISLHPL